MYVQEKRFGEIHVPADAEAQACVDRAIAKIKRGWCQFAPVTKTAMCAGHAIMSSGPGNMVVYAACRAYLLKICGHDSIPRWNDTSGRTKAEIINMLLAVRKKL